MKCKIIFLLAMFGTLVSSGLCVAVDSPLVPEVAGVVGMTPITENSYAAVWIPVGKKQALAGLKWYNNDSSVAFPELLIASGAADQPAFVGDCLGIGENVSGASSNWSEFRLDAPIASSRGGFYVLFRFPEDGAHVGEGLGGGSGIGYVENGGTTGWLSADGQDWIKVGRSCGFAVVPEFVAAEDWMLDKSGGLDDPDEAESSQDQPERFATALLPAYPNPFNPATDIAFSLEAEGRVKIVVYDVKGRRIIDLVDEPRPAGAHIIRWDGRNNHGQRVSSGTYLVQMRMGTVLATRRVMLVK